MIRIETNDGPFEIDPVELRLYQVRGDLGAAMFPIGPAQWVSDIPLGGSYRIDKIISNKHVSYALYRRYEDKDVYIGDVTVK